MSKNSWNTTGLETQYRCLCKLPSPHPSAYLPDINEMFRSTKCKSLLLIQIKSSLPGLREEMTDSVRPWEPNIENSIGKWSANQSTQIHENWANIQRHWKEIKYKYQILGNVLAERWSFKTDREILAASDYACQHSFNIIWGRDVLVRQDVLLAFSNRKDKWRSGDWMKLFSVLSDEKFSPDPAAAGSTSDQSCRTM